MVLDVEQARGGQPVEVEGGERPADPDAGGGGVPIDRLRLGHDEGVERPADGVRQRGQSVERVVGHGRFHSIACRHS